MHISRSGPEFINKVCFLANFNDWQKAIKFKNSLDEFLSPSTILIATHAFKGRGTPARECSIAIQYDYGPESDGKKALDAQETVIGFSAFIVTPEWSDIESCDQLGAALRVILKNALMAPNGDPGPVKPQSNDSSAGPQAPKAPARGLAKRSRLAVLSFLSSNDPINIAKPNYAEPTGFSSEADLFSSIPIDGPVIVYVLGHSYPDAIITPDGQTRSAQELISNIQSRRRPGEKALIIWDMCFAAVFQEGAGSGATPNWGADYVHIVGCASFERAWHFPGNPATTLLSIKLNEVFADGIPPNWDELQSRLKTKFGHLQSPTVIAPVGSPTIEFFFPPIQA